MIGGIGEAAMGAMTQENRLHVIMNNLANSSTVGFRRDYLTFKGVLSDMLPDKNGFVKIMPEVDKVTFDPNEGDYEHTGNTFDLAIEGRGFFMLRDKDTEKVYYTRAGNFITGPSGNLISADGKFEVLNDAKEPVVLNLTDTSEINIDSNGKIYVRGAIVGNVGVADFDDYDKLLKTVSTLFDAGNQEARVMAAPIVRAEFLESSTVDPIEEMAQMTEALRILETNLQVIRFQDSTLDRAVNDLGRLR